MDWNDVKESQFRQNCDVENKRSQKREKTRTQRTIERNAAQICTPTHVNASQEAVMKRLLQNNGPYEGSLFLTHRSFTPREASFCLLQPPRPNLVMLEGRTTLASTMGLTRKKEENHIPSLFNQGSPLVTLCRDPWKVGVGWGWSEG